MSTTDRAREISRAAHAGQVDLAGEPYIRHVERVAAAVPNRLRTVALLHDVAEDTSWTIADLVTAGFDLTVVATIDALTRRHSETYTGYILRVARNADAREVKLADLEDNMRSDRLPQPLGRRDRDRLAKYRDARALLLAAGRLEERLRRQGAL